MATSLKHQNEILADENKELARILNAFRDGDYNTVAGAKLLADEQLDSLRRQVEE